MGHRQDEDGRTRPEAHESEAFWEDVECEMRLVGAREFGAFLEADSLPYEPRPEFEQALLRHLKRRYLNPPGD